MPRYDYRCDECGDVYEMTHGFDRDASGDACWDATCPGQLVRVFPMPWIHYKGYGFHTTDSRSADEKYAFDHFDGSGDNPEKAAMQRRIKDPDSTVPNF